MTTYTLTATIETEERPAPTIKELAQTVGVPAEQVRSMRVDRAPADARERAQAMARQCATFVNSFGVDGRAFAEEMTCQHRTLQQSFTRLVVSFLRAEAQANADPRNQDAVKAAQVMITALDQAGINLPLV